MSPLRVLVISLQVGGTASKGHLNPLVGVVQWLMSRGHQVSWLPLPAAFGPADRAQLADVGVEVVEPPPLPPGALPSHAELNVISMDPTRIWEAYRAFLLDPVPHLLPEIDALLRRLRPDIALIDTMAYTGIIACEQAGVPWVGACAGLKLLHPPGFSAAYRGDMSAVVAPRAELFARYGLAPDFRLFECPSPAANVVFGTEELVGAADPPTHTWLVGPSIPPRRRGDETEFPFDRIAGRKPLVYAAFGSVHTRLKLDDVVDPLVSATAKLGATLVISSEIVVDSGAVLPDHVIAVRYTPQLKLLERADAFVTHGGANSVMEGMFSGVPLLVVPLTSDQPWQAELVDRARAGVSLEREDVTTDSAMSALTRLLDPDGPIRASVDRIQRAYRARDGARRAAELVEEIASHPAR